jgi:hypothetical protein
MLVGIILVLVLLALAAAGVWFLIGASGGRRRHRR